MASKVFISNLNYSTTEDELRAFLGDTATNVFIPNYFVGFNNSRAKPLGIAYADLPNPEAAEEFIKKFNGVQFKERKIRAKHHVPYVPDANKHSGVRSSSLAALSKQVPGYKGGKKDETSVSEKHEFSSNSIFIKGLKAKSSEPSLLEFFKDYNPTDVKIQKLRGWIRGFKNRAYNAVVTLDLPPEKSLDDVINEAQARQEEWPFLSLAKAYATKEKRASVGKGAGAAGEDGGKPIQEQAEAVPDEDTQNAAEKPAEKPADIESVATVSAEEQKTPLEEIKSSAENIVIAESLTTPTGKT